jgi:alpha-L-arabinofuranosidase
LTRIAIDPARPVGRLDRKVFGGFVEHLGRCTVDPARLYFFDPGTGQAITG